VKAAPATAPAPAPAPAPAATATIAPVAAASPPTDSSPDVQRLLQAVERRRQVLRAHLDEAQALELADGELRIYRPPGDQALPRALERNGNRSALEEALLEVCGPGWRWRLVDGAPPPAPAAPSPQVTAAAADPSVQAVLDIFGGTISSVERGASIDKSGAED